MIVKGAIDKPSMKGHADEAGWNDRMLIRKPFADGNHFEFHFYNDDVLMVYFKRESKKRIRMVGIYDHESLPNS